MSIWTDIIKSIGIGQSATMTINADVANINKTIAFLKPLSAEFTAFHDAWMAEDIQAELMAGLSITETFLSIAGIVFPQAALAAKSLEILVAIIPVLVPMLIKFGGEMIPDERGGWVPKHGWPLLDKDGNFTGTYSP